MQNQSDTSKHDTAKQPADKGLDETACCASFDVGERKLIEMTAGKPEHSRFSVCFWLPAGWHFDDGPLATVESRGYSVVAIHELPPRTF